MSESRRDTLAFGWASRVAVELVTAAVAFAAGVLVATRLGPAGKGEASTLGYLVAVVTTVGTLGLGEASATMHGRRGVPLSRSLSASLPVVGMASAVCTLVVLVVAKLQLAGNVSTDSTVIAVCVSVPVIVLARSLLAFLDAAHRVVLSSTLRLVMTLATGAATWVLVIGLDRGVAGALAAPIAGAATVVVLSLAALRTLGARLLPRVDVEYVRDAVRYGSPLMISVVILVLAGRADIFLVRALSDNVDTGLYSVALTLSQLAMYPSDALLGAAFPRLARLDPGTSLAYITRITRAGIAAAAVTSVLIGAVTPLVVPLVFGEAFRPSIVPTLILLVSSVLYGAQTLLSRARAASGRPGLAVSSFTVSLVTMLALDVALIPPLGIRGAALASVLASIAGVSVALRAYRRAFGTDFHWKDLIPRRSDVTELVSVLLSPRMSAGPGQD